MDNRCREKIYSEDYLDYLVEYYPIDLQDEQSSQGYCFEFASHRFAVLYEEGSSYDDARVSSVYAIPHCYGLLSSEQVLDSSGVSMVRRQAGLSLLGQGVLVGFVDTGIDYSHPAFINSDGTSRILGIWDQTVEELREGEHAPEILGYGAEYTKEDIDRALASDDPLSIVPSQDTEGHGTFLAGVACGNIMQEQGFSGIAPLASICMVKCKQAKQNLRNYYFINTPEPCYAENDIMLAIRYLRFQAYKYEMPIVICIGLGTSFGGHSQGGILGQLMEEYGDYRGTLIVAAGGNEANASHHYLSNYADDRTEDEVEIRVGENEFGFTMEFWAAATDLYSVGIISPGGEYSGKTQARLGEKRQIRFLFEKTIVYIEYVFLSVENGDECIRIRFRDPTPGIWKIQVFHEYVVSKRYDMWLPIKNFISDQTYFLRPDPNTTLCDPSNNGGIITCSYYNTENRGIAIESGRGFTIGNAIKPDIAAPGVNVFGPLPFAGNYPTDEQMRNNRARYGLWNGSSGAAAVTAGAVALLAEWAYIGKNDIVMDTQKAKRYLIRGANRAGIATPSREWGYGTLDIYSTFDRLRPQQ